MLRTSKCSSSGRLVLAVLWNFFHATIEAVWSMAGCASSTRLVLAVLWNFFHASIEAVWSLVA
jgi:hypothetical protein